MKATQLYKQLEKDFITPKMSDEWAQYMDSVADFLSENFKKRSMGLVCDFATEINKVYTAVFPSREVMQRILDDGTLDAMLFVHHPSTWDIRKAPEVFQQMDRELLQQFKKKTDCATVQDLKNKFQEIVNHEVILYNYGDNNINERTVAVVAGGGLDETIEEIAQNKVNVLVTGITAKNDHSRKAHEFAEKHIINVLGGTHYSTERFACISMIDYFEKIGFPSEFIEDEPVLEDM